MAMYLSSLEIDTSDTRGRTWLASPYRVHQRLLMAFPDQEANRILFRIESERDLPRIIVQSAREPDWDAAFGGHPVLATPARQKRIEVRVQGGERLRFFLRANPTRRSVRHTAPATDGDRPRGKRVGLMTESEQRAWLERKGGLGGFRPTVVAVCPRGQITFQRGSNRPGEQTHLAVDFEGELVVADPALFGSALAEGIGAAKAFGFGLLSIAPAG